MVMEIKTDTDTLYIILPLMITQLDVLCTIKKYRDLGYDVVNIYDWTSLGNDQDFVNQCSSI